MKKTILTLALFTAFGVNAQIKVQENTVKDSVVWRASKLLSVPNITRFASEEDTSYTIYYQNAKYTTITDIDYVTIGSKEDLKQFLNLCLDVIDNGKEYSVEVDGKNWIIVKSMMYVSVWSEHTSFALTRKQVESAIEKL